MLYFSSTRLLILAMGIACALFIIAYGTFRCKATSFKDPFTKSMFGSPWNLFLDGWGILHFLFYMLLAYIWPSEWAFIFLMGAMWELVEFIFKDHPFYLSKCKYYIETDNGAGWWYGRWQDLVMNGLGIATGAWLGGK